MCTEKLGDKNNIFFPTKYPLKPEQNLERGKKAHKSTATILAAVVGCFGTPLLPMVFFRNIYGEEISSGVKTASRHIGMLLMILNPVINPIIYTVKNKQFRIAFIEILQRKSYQEATAVERRLFGVRNNAVEPQTRLQAEIKGDDQNEPVRNQVLREDNPGRNSEVILHGATFADGNTPMPGRRLQMHLTVQTNHDRCKKRKRRN